MLTDLFCENNVSVNRRHKLTKKLTYRERGVFEYQVLNGKLIVPAGYQRKSGTPAGWVLGIVVIPLFS